MIFQYTCIRQVKTLYQRIRCFLQYSIRKYERLLIFPSGNNVDRKVNELPLKLINLLLDTDAHKNKRGLKETNRGSVGIFESDGNLVKPVVASDTRSLF